MHCSIEPAIRERVGNEVAVFGRWLGADLLIHGFAPGLARAKHQNGDAVLKHLLRALEIRILDPHMSSPALPGTNLRFALETSLADCLS